MLLFSWQACRGAIGATPVAVNPQVAPWTPITCADALASKGRSAGRFLALQADRGRKTRC